MAELKTQPTDDDVVAFLAAIPDERRRTDARAICALMSELSGEPPVMWGDSLVGFGSYAYTYASGRSGEWFATGFQDRQVLPACQAPRRCRRGGPARADHPLSGAGARTLTAHTHLLFGVD